MPRKRIYHTREQQRQANNAKAKKWRDKNVEFVKSWREEKKQEWKAMRTYETSQHAITPDRAQELRDKCQKAMKRRNVKESHSNKGLDEAAELKLDAELIRCTSFRLYNDFRQKAPNNVDYLKCIYQKYTTLQAYGTQMKYRHHSYLQDVAKPLNKLQDMLRKEAQAILQVAGPWDEWRRVEHMKVEVRELTAWINDMWCFAVISLLELQHAYRMRELRFRQVYNNRGL
ncbi:hypothetical protein V5O48_015104 [Marasmius crinis-equi]|uniref:Uncharacterized protein n=1 Tax=Marasmius crinis-equi TaxID=585013 RepID=A0ABR3EVG9_9AGAR